MKRIFTLLFAAMLAGQAWAQTTFEVGNLKYTVIEGTSNVSVCSSGEDLPANLVIPSKVENGGTTYTVTTIADQAFDWCSELESVTIPSSITTIGNNIFKSCAYITEIIVDGGNTAYSSKDGVLFNKDKTELIYYPANKTGAYTIPNTVTIIGDGAFKYCGEHLTAVTIQNSVTTIGASAFEGCKALTSITIPNSVTSIGDGAFSSCYELDIVTMSNAITSISENLFSGCKLTSFEIPSGVTSIESYAFYACDIESLIIPNTVTIIKSNAFQRCRELKKLIIPISVTTVSAFAFSENDNLTIYCEAEERPEDWSWSWNLNEKDAIWGYTPSSQTWTVTVSVNNSTYGNVSGGGTVADGSTTTITASPASGYKFVKWSNGLTTASATITVTSDTTLVAEFAPKEPLVASELHYEITSDSTVEVVRSDDYLDMTTIVIPETVEIDGETYTVTRIGTDAFRDCKKLTSLNLSKTVTEIDLNALRDCSGLTEINVDGANTTLSSVDGVVFNKDKTELIRCPLGKTGSYTIPSSVTDIHYGAFLYCHNLMAIDIPNSVKHIDGAAFMNCVGLTEIAIPEGITEIASQIFDGCTSLTSVTIPESVTEIGGNAFEYCSSLTSITIPQNVTSISSSAFRGCDNLTEMNLNGHSNYSFENQTLFNKDKTELLCCLNSKVTEYTIPNTVIKIGDYAFTDCDLESITIPNSVTTIGYDAFYRCWYLTSITLPESLTEIGGYAFAHCGNLKTVIMPESVVKIEESAFYRCDSLAFNEYENTLYLGTNDNPYFALIKAKSTDITSCKINSQCKIIAKDAFYDCDNLQYNEYDNAMYLGSSENQYYMLVKAKSTDIKSCEINSGCRLIWNSAFSNCSKLTSVIVPDGVVQIGDYAFFYCDSLTSINIPDGVTKIGESAFYNCESLTSITIPDGITSIGEYTFNNCESLTSVTIPESVSEIGYSAFFGCSKLTSINIPSGVTSIGNWAIGRCGSLTTINIPKTVTTIGEGAFSSCYNLNIFCEAESKPDGWNDKWNRDNRPVVWGFDVNKKIFKVTLSTEYDWRGTVAGGGWAADSSTVTITATPEDGYHFVKWSNGLTNATETITVTSDTTLVAEFAEDKYWTVTLLANIEQGTVGRISGSNLDGSIYTVFASPKTGYKFVKWSNGLTTDTISITLTSDTTLTAEFAEKVYAGTCGDDARWSFNVSSKTLTISGTGSIDRYKTVSVFSTEVDRPWQEIADQIEKVVIGEGITNLGSHAFCYLNNLKEAIISSTCDSYGGMSFAYCPNLKKLVVAANSVYQANEYCFSNYDSCTVCVPAGRVDYYKKDIIFGMFKNIVGGYTVTIDDEIKNGMVEVESYIVPEGGTVTVTPIPDEGYSIADVYFEGEYGYDCYTINSNSHQFWIENVRSNIVVKVEFSREGDFEFGFNYKILSDNTIEISSYKGTGGDVIIPSTVIDNGVEYTVTRIGDNAFSKNNSNIETIIIPNTVTSIGSGAFSNLYLTSLTIPNSVTEIGEGAFGSIKNIVYKGNATGSPWEALTVNGYIDGNCIFADAEKTHLTAYINPSDTIETTIYIPEAVISIGANAFTNVWAKKIDDGYYLGNDENPYLILWHVGDFMGDSEITSYEIKDGCKYIYYTAFANMQDLESVTIPNSVISIGKLAFFGCDNLKSVNIPDGVVAIGEGAFSNCYGLSSITIPKSVSTIDKYAFGDCDNLTITCEVSSKPEGWDNEWNSPSSTVNWAEIDVAIAETAANAINIYAYGNTIVVENATEEIRVYNAMGALVGREAQPSVSTEIRVNTTGVYIVKVGTMAKRVMINN